MPKPVNCDLNLRGLNRNTKDQFKAFCARRGYSMVAAVEALMLAAVAADEPLRLRGRFVGHKANEPDKDI